jgi:hypothetical protein
MDEYEKQSRIERGKNRQEIRYAYPLPVIY